MILHLNSRGKKKKIKEHVSDINLTNYPENEVNKNQSGAVDLQ